MKRSFLLSVALVSLVAGCSQQEEPAMVDPEPMYDKYGNAIIEPAVASGGVEMVDTDGDGVPDTPAPGPVPEDETSPYRNQNQTGNQNQNQNG